MTQPRPNIHELARLSGFSVGTVSRALNGYADVRAETRETILRVARELDYTPSASARTLVTQRSHVIGVFLDTGEGHPDLQHPFFHEVLGGVKNLIGSAGYDLLLFASERPGNGFGTHSYLKRCRHHNVDGAVLMGLDADDPEVRRLDALRRPDRRRRRRARGTGDELRDAPTTRAARRSPSATCMSWGTAGSRRSPACSRSARAPTACAATATSCRRAG